MIIYAAPLRPRKKRVVAVSRQAIWAKAILDTGRARLPVRQINQILEAALVGTQYKMPRSTCAPFQTLRRVMGWTAHFRAGSGWRWQRPGPRKQAA